MKKYKRYSELIRLASFMDRFEYLRMNSKVGESSFGFDRYLNQALYTSSEWRSVRDKVILRDNGCDLGIEDRPIGKGLIVHHLNPITVIDIQESNPDIFNPEYLICVSHETHNAIHFGDARLLIPDKFNDRKPGDTRLW